MKTTELLNEHCEFNSPYDCYVLLAVSRKKDTPEITNSQEIVFREVIKNKEDIIRKYNKIKSQIINYMDENNKKFPFYLYVSLNARDSLKATFILKNNINHWLQETIRGVDNSKMFKKVHGYFYSALMKPESRTSQQKYFMLDIDTKDVYKIEKIDRIFEIENIDVKLIQETKNGFHIKTKPFDRRVFEDLLKDIDFEIKTDANLFLEYVKND
jgi:hypothetical protein